MTITDFTALTLRLPLLDRATLSQAWRDALHRTPLRPSSGTPRSLLASTSMEMGPAARRIGDSRLLMRIASLSSHSTPRRGSALVPGAQRPEASTRSRFVRSAEPTKPVKPVTREQFSVTLANGERLCVLVTSGRQGLIVTLLCAAHLQEEMHRALARLAEALVSTAVQVRVMEAKRGSSWRA